MRPVKLTEVTVRLEASMSADLPDGSFAGFNRAAIAFGGTVEAAAATAAREVDATIRADLDAMVRIIEGGTTRDGEQLWTPNGKPWEHEAYAGALVDAGGCLWVQMDNWPGNQWLSPTGHGLRDWEALEFPVRLAAPGWEAVL